MDIEQLTSQERTSKKYAEEFFSEEWEMEDLFKIDTEILDRFIIKGKLLDAAMGPGRHVKHFAKKGLTVFGNDFNKYMIKEAHKYVKNKKVKYLNHDMRDLSSVPDNFFDHVICVGASLGGIYKSHQRQKAVMEFSRVVKNSGYVIIHAHNLFEISEFSDLINIVKMLGKRILKIDNLEMGDVIYEHSESFNKAYMHWFKPSELRQIMRKAGLMVIHEYYLRGLDQDRILVDSWRKYIQAGGFVFVGKKA